MAATGLAAAALLSGVAIGGCSDVRAPDSSSPAPIASNTALAARVRAALHAAPYVNDIHIDVFIENGNVVLSGLVEDERALMDVLDIAKQAADGHKVIDAITIMKTSPR